MTSLYGRKKMYEPTPNPSSQQGNPSQPTRSGVDEIMLQALLEYRRTGRAELQERVVTHYTNLVESIARRFSGTAEPFEDLVQEGYIGLLNAIELYDASKNVKFPTYATHFIVGQIRHHLRDRGKIIKEPAWLQELNHRITRVVDSLTQQMGTAPSNQQIAGMMKMSEDEVAELMMTREVFKVSSISGGSEQENDNGDMVDIERKEIGVSFQLPVEDRIVLDTAMSQLKAMEQRVITEFYFNDLTQSEIARRMGISCNYVSHILRSSTKKLKKILSNEELQEVRQRVDTLQRKLEEQTHFIEQNVIVDPLTRFYNRRYFSSRLEEELTRASRHRYEIALLFIKIEGLRDFSRTVGTQRADEVLLRTAHTLRHAVRKVDIVTRYDKETFAVIMPYTGAKVSIVEERLCNLLRDLFVAQEWNKARSPIATRLNTAVYPQDGLEEESLLRKATSPLHPALEAKSFAA